ncbi:MAG: VCBS repeat-containing protein, partial [Bacteroidota bacterium]
MKSLYTFLLSCVLCSVAFGQQAFTEVSAEAGIEHVFVVDLATFGGGAAVIDYDNDGWEDLYITGGALSDALYKNNGDGTFKNVFSQSGFASTQLAFT